MINRLMERYRLIIIAFLGLILLIALFYNSCPADGYYFNKYMELKIKSYLFYLSNDIDKEYKYGSTLLHEAAYYNHPDIIKFLLSRGADVEKRDDFGSTPLMRGYRGNTSAVQLLISNGADLHVKDVFGTTLLHLAINGGDIDSINMLISAGIDVNSQDNFGRTPLHSIVFVSGKKINAPQIPISLIEHDFKVAEILIDNGADVNLKDNDGNSPLHNAITDGNTLMIDFLKKHGAKI